MTGGAASEVEFLTQRHRSNRERSISTSSSCTLRLSEERSLSSEENCIFADDLIDLTSDEFNVSKAGLLREGEVPLTQYRNGNWFIREGDLLEIEHMFLGNYRVDFVSVRVIAQCQATGRTKVRGIPLARNRCLLGKLPRKANEVCMILEYNQQNPNSEVEALIDINPVSVISRRPPLVITNTLYPEHCNPTASEHSGNLTCR